MCAFSVAKKETNARFSCVSDSASMHVDQSVHDHNIVKNLHTIPVMELINLNSSSDCIQFTTQLIMTQAVALNTDSFNLNAHQN